MIAVCAYGAESGTRTHTPLMALAFEASMSTNSIISAYKYQAETRAFRLALASGYSIVQTLELNQFHFALYWNLVFWNPKTRSFTEE